MTLLPEPRRHTLRHALSALLAIVVSTLIGAAAGCGRKPEKTAEAEPAAPSAARSAQRAAKLRERQARHRQGQPDPEKMQAAMARIRSLEAEKPDSAGRAFIKHLSSEQEVLLATALDRFRAAPDDSARMALLEELAEVPSERTIAVVKEALAAGDPDVREQAFAVIEGYTVADILPLARQGLADPEPEVRLAAVNSLAAVTDADVTALLLDALQDPDAFVRQAVFGVLEGKSAEIRQEIYDAGINSTHEDVWDEVITALMFNPSQDGMYTLLEGLKSSSQVQRDRVNAAFYFLVSERFRTYDEGRRWWEANRNRFDDELEEKDDGAEP